jgi:hypothetical protein
MPTLLDLASHSFKAILDHLSASEAVRTQALVSKTLDDKVDPGFWSRSLCQRLGHLVPARAYFDGPDNPSNNTLKGLSGRDRFPDHAQQCDDHLHDALQDGGAAGSAWTWDISTSSVPSVDTLNFLKQPRLTDASVEALLGRGHSRVDFGLWAVAFACDECGAPGEATRQCAGCGELLCRGCSVGCALDGTPESAGGKGVPLLCPFVLCQPCHEELSLGPDYVLRDDLYDSEDPGLSPPVCTYCPSEELRCPMHVDCCILMCADCGERACIDHSNGFNGGNCLGCCGECHYPQCAECGGWGFDHPEGRPQLLYCVDPDGDGGCFYIGCTECHPSGICPECASELKLDGLRRISHCIVLSDSYPDPAVATR